MELKKQVSEAMAKYGKPGRSGRKKLQAEIDSVNQLIDKVKTAGSYHPDTVTHLETTRQHLENDDSVRAFNSLVHARQQHYNRGREPNKPAAHDEIGKHFDNLNKRLYTLGPFYPAK